MGHIFTAVVASGVILAISLTITLPLGAHGGATGIVKERMDAMDAVGDAMDAISDMVRGKTDFDSDSWRSNAEIVQRHAGDALTSLFPEGSLDHPTEALPVIWEDWSTFSDYADQLERCAGALVAAADYAGEDPMMGGTPGQGHMMGQGAGGQGHMMDRGGHMMGGPGGGMAGPASHCPGGSAEFTDGPMPPHMAFMAVTQTCNACHTRFRKEK